MNNKRKYIVSFSGGKDSTCMLLKLLEENYPVDEIVFMDTGKEFQGLYKHINKVEKYINRPITRLKSDESFEYYMFNHLLTTGKGKGMNGYGWPTIRTRWCTIYLKINVIGKYLRNKYGRNYTEYIGIAVDEFKRTKEKNKIYPLVDWNITEAMALRYCYEKGFNWDGLYEHFDRVSCWCCPLGSQKSYYILYKFYPELWEELKDMDSKARNKFNQYYSVQEFENMFKKFEENNKCIKINDIV